MKIKKKCGLKKPLHETGAVLGHFRFVMDNLGSRKGDGHKNLV